MSAVNFAHGKATYTNRSDFPDSSFATRVYVNTETNEALFEKPDGDALYYAASTREIRDAVSDLTEIAVGGGSVGRWYNENVRSRWIYIGDIARFHPRWTVTMEDDGNSTVDEAQPVIEVDNPDVSNAGDIEIQPFSAVLDAPAEWPVSMEVTIRLVAPPSDMMERAAAVAAALTEGGVEFTLTGVNIVD